MIGLTEYTFRLSPILSITSYIFIFFINLKKGTLPTTRSPSLFIYAAVAAGQDPGRAEKSNFHLVKLQLV